MKIENDLSELNAFVHAEFSSILQVYGFQKMPPKALKAITSGILKRRAIYDKIIHKEDKFRSKVEWAHFTMPHGWLWKMFHRRVWYHVQKRIDEEASEPLVPETDSSVADDIEPLVPSVVKPVDLSALSFPTEV